MEKGLGQSVSGEADAGQERKTYLKNVLISSIEY
jgi:hypothetical protein